MNLRKTLGKWMQNKGAVIAGSTSISATDPEFKGNFFRALGSMNPKFINLACAADIAKAWEQCPPLVSIICGLAQSDLSGTLTFKYVDSDEEVNLSKQLTARAMSKLLARPNPLQTWRQFRSQQNIYKRLFGSCPVLCIKPFGFDDPLSTKSMWNLPPQNVKITTTGKLFYQSDASGIIEKIEIQSNGKKDQVRVEDVFFLKDQYVSLNYEAVPSSRVAALQYPISNIIAAYKASNVLIEKRGALGILSNSSKDAAGPSVVLPEDREQLQEDFQRYGLSEDNWQIIITSATLAWQQIALPIKELMLFETIQDGTMQCCAVYNYPYELMPAVKGSTFNNVNAAEKRMYQNEIIPANDSDMEAYNAYFGLEDKGIKLDMDFSHVPVLQEDAQKQANAGKTNAERAKIMFESNAITLNRMRELQGEETVSGDDIYFYQWAGNPSNAQQNGTETGQTEAGTEETSDNTGGSEGD